MAGRGPAPKPSHLRQRTNKKAGATVLEMPPVGESVEPGKAEPETPAREIPNPDGRTWHPLTLSAWARAWASPMANQWLDSDEDALGRLACLWDQFYKSPEAKVMAEIRLQEQRFGLSPLDRSRLSWEVAKSSEAEERQARRQRPGKTGTDDPRRGLMAVVK